MRDQNTKYFYAHATQRKNTNRIHSITDEDGRGVSSHAEINRTFHYYFQNLFTSSNLSVSDIEVCLEMVEMNEAYSRSLAKSKLRNL